MLKDFHKSTGFATALGVLLAAAAVFAAGRSYGNFERKKGGTPARLIRIEDFERIKAERGIPREAVVLDIEGEYYLPDTLLDHKSKRISEDPLIEYLRSR